MANIADIKLNERVHWGREQEELLQGLLQTKARFEQNKEPLHKYIFEKYNWTRTGETNKAALAMRLTEWLMVHAGTIRDLLKPFDDGTRQTVSKKKTSTSGPGCPGR